MTEKEIEHYEAIIKRWGEKYHLLEKELLQTKKNFRNSQVHSKNCYKKLKEKFDKVKEVYHRNYELIQENQKLKETFKKRAELCSEFSEYNRQYEKALDFLMDKFKLELKGNRLYFLYNNQYFELDKEQAKLLKEVFESVGDSDE